MSAYYLESSAAIKAYDAEVGTDWVVKLINSQEVEELFLGHLAVVETISGLRRKLAAVEGANLAGDTRQTRSRELREAIRRFRADTLASRYTLVSVTTPIIERAADLAEQHSLRGYDAVHLATILQLTEERRSPLSPVELVSADHELLEVAQAEGLVTWNPNEQE